MSVEEKIAELDSKIDYHRACLKKLEEKKTQLLNPKEKLDMKKVAAIVRASGLSVDELAAKLNVTIHK